MSSFVRFLEIYGHEPRPAPEDAFRVWQGDFEGPADFCETMAWMWSAQDKTTLREWCAATWRAKVAWARFLNHHVFPLPLADVRTVPAAPPVGPAPAAAAAAPPACAQVPVCMPPPRAAHSSEYPPS